MRAHRAWHNLSVPSRGSLQNALFAVIYERQLDKEFALQRYRTTIDVFLAKFADAEWEELQKHFGKAEERLAAYIHGDVNTPNHRRMLLEDMLLEVEKEIRESQRPERMRAFTV